MRSTRQISGLSARFDLFNGFPNDEDGRRVRNAAQSGRRFVSGDPASLFIGTTPLFQYLRDSGETTPLKVSRLLDEQDWRMFVVVNF